MQETTSKTKLQIDLSKLSEHLQKCQYAVLALTFSILLLALATPEKPPALQELDKLQNTFVKLGDRWIDHYLCDQTPTEIEHTGPLEVLLADKNTMVFENPVGLLINPSFAQNIIFGLSENANLLVSKDGLGLFTDNRKRGFPPIWADTDELIKFSTGINIKDRKDIINCLSLLDINELWKRFSIQYDGFYIELTDAKYLIDSQNPSPLQIKISKNIINVKRITEELPSNINISKSRTGKLWCLMKPWQISEDEKLISRKKPLNNLIIALPDVDSPDNMTDGIFFLVKIKKQTINLFEPIQRICVQLGIDSKISFENTFPELSIQSSERKSMPLSGLKQVLEKESKDPGKKLNAEVLGIKVEGLHVWWLLPLALFLVQLYFILHIHRLFLELKQNGNNKNSIHPLGMIYPGKYSWSLGFLFLFLFPIIISLSAFFRLKYFLNGFNFEVGLLFGLAILILFTSSIILYELSRVRNFLHN